MIDDIRLQRHSRHILLNEFDIAGQEALDLATVLIVGCGGLANACAPILAGAGVGHIILCDDDTVELSNLPRQLAFAEQDIGRPKAEVLAEFLRARNSGIRISVISQKADQAFLSHCLKSCTAVADCSDNAATRHTVNRAALNAHIPLISASVIRFSGQLAVFDGRNPDSPCYACLFPDTEEQEDTCTKNGVFSPLVQIIGGAQAAETIKVISGIGTSSVGKIKHFEGLDISMHEFEIESNLCCPVCKRESPLSI